MGEHDGAGLGDADRGRGDDGVEAVEVGGGQPVVGHRRRGRRQGRPSGTTTRAPAAAARRRSAASTSARRSGRRPPGSPRPARRTASTHGRPGGRRAVAARDVHAARRRRRPARAGRGRGSPRGRSVDRSSRRCASTRPGTTPPAAPAGPGRRSRPRPGRAAGDSSRRPPGERRAADAAEQPADEPGGLLGARRAAHVGGEREGGRLHRQGLGLAGRGPGARRRPARAGRPAPTGCRCGPGRPRSTRRTATRRTAASRSARRGRRREQRGEDRADRAGVDRAVGVAAGALVDRADVEAGRAADAAQRLPADLVGEHAGAAVVEQHDVDLLRPVAGRHARSTSRCTGSSARRSRSAAAAAGTPRGRARSAPPSRCRPRRSAPRAGSGTSGRCPRTRRRRACRSRRPRSWRRETADLGAQELLAQVQPGRLGQPGRLVGEVVRRGPPDGAPSARRKISRISRAVAVDRRAPGCGWAGRRRAARSARPGRSPTRRCPPRPGASLRPISWVAIDLTLTTSSTPCGLRRPRRRSRSPRRRRAPSARSRRRAVSDASSCTRCVVEVAQACRP